jgi:DNA (cytosine-5)-methyltransferase 1
MVTAKKKATLKKEMHERTCIELFAGTGGMMVGLEDAGFKTLVANEVHPHPCMTIRRNFPETPVLNASIRDITGHTLLEHAKLSKKLVGNIDLLAGGPPCQGFSTAGIKDKNDPRNTLIGDYIRMIKDLQPLHFIIENVSGLVSLHGGALFENVLNELDALNYNISHQILKVADYGVPQMRKRLIILGSRSGPAPKHPEPTHGENYEDDLFLTTLKKYVTCGDAIGDLPAIGAGEIATTYSSPPRTEFQRLMRKGARKLHNHESSKHREEVMKYYALIPPGGTALDIPEKLRNGKQGVQRWPLNGISRTITTEPTDFLHPILHRAPTVREMARMQSFPDHYEFLGQRTTGNKMRRLGYCSQTQQVGNAVPPLFAKAIGLAIQKMY